MFSQLFTVATIAIAAVSTVSALPVRVTRHHEIAARATPAAPFFPNPKGWPSSLESYDPYHKRYIALDCKSKHGDAKFFNTCCIPLGKSQKLSSRPEQCDPTKVKASNDDNDDNDDDCDDEDEDPTPTPSSSATQNQPTSPATPTKTASTTTKKSTSAQATPTSGSGSGAFNTGGQATFYEQGGAAGACGKKHSDDDLIVALDIKRYGNPDAVSKWCGKKLEIVNLKNKKRLIATVADVCPTCIAPAGGNVANSLDMSHGTFFGLGGTRDEGVFNIEWREVS